MTTMLIGLNNVKVRNVGDTTANLAYNSVPYQIPPGAEGVVPFEAVVIACGDPRAGAEPQRIAGPGGDIRFIPARNDEIKRVRQLYGMHGIGGEFEIAEGPDPETGQVISFPKLEVFDDRGERLFTVLEDPQGARAHGLVVPAHVRQEQAARDEEFERMKRQLALMEERQNKIDAGIASPTHAYTPVMENELPTDEAPDMTAPSFTGGPADAIDWATTEGG